jgi:hypothetical protein
VRTRWRALHAQLVSAAATAACPRAKYWHCKDVKFSAEVRHRGVLVFIGTFGPFGANHGAQDHSLESNRGEAVRFAAHGGGARVRRPCVTAGDLQTPGDFTLDVHVVNVARGCAVARLCAGICGAETGAVESDDEQEASLTFSVQLPSVCRDSVVDGEQGPEMQLHLWFQAQDDIPYPSDCEEEEEDEQDRSTGDPSEELLFWAKLRRRNTLPADVERRMRARRVVVRPRVSGKYYNEAEDEYVEMAPATLCFEDRNESNGDGTCTCGQLCAALDVLHWAA